ncbi:MAG: hypothetical protein ACE5HE_08835 [Phycisphaerae bacterium]
MFESLKGWKTYLVFAATLVLALAKAWGWGGLDAGAETTIAQIVDLLTHPVVMSILALILRKITDGPAAL